MIFIGYIRCLVINCDVEFEVVIKLKLGSEGKEYRLRSIFRWVVEL